MLEVRISPESCQKSVHVWYRHRRRIVVIELLEVDRSRSSVLQKNRPPARLLPETEGLRLRLSGQTACAVGEGPLSDLLLVRPPEGVRRAVGAKSVSSPLLLSNIVAKRETVVYYCSLSLIFHKLLQAIAHFAVRPSRARNSDTNRTFSLGLGCTRPDCSSSPPSSSSSSSSSLCLLVPALLLRLALTRRAATRSQRQRARRRFGSARRRGGGTCLCVRPASSCLARRR